MPIFVPTRAAAAALALATACVVVAGSAGCPGRAPADEVVFWAMGAEAEAADALLDPFRREHPEWTVRVQQVPWSAAHEKLLTAFVGGTLPDVFQLGNTWVPEFAMLGALEPLDGRVAASALVEAADFWPGSLEPNRYGARLVALPWTVDARVLFYRDDLFRAAGVDAPPRNWEAWTAALRAVRDAARREGRERHAIFLPVDEWQTPVALALEAGSPLLVGDDGRDAAADGEIESVADGAIRGGAIDGAAGAARGAFRADAARRAFGFYVDLHREGLAPVRTASQLAGVHREFAAGSFASFVTGPWNLGELARRMPPQLAGAWATAPMPAERGDGVGLSVAGGSSVAVAASSTHKDAAWSLVEYLLSAPVQARLRGATGDLPSRRSAWQDTDPRAAAFRVQLDHLAAVPRVPEWERIASRLVLRLEQAVREESTLDEALAALDSDVDSILAKRRSLAAAAEASR